MAIPVSVTHDPLAQTMFGLCGINPDTPQISGIALITFGFLWTSWYSCYDSVSTTWAACAGVTVTTTWTRVEEPI